MLSSISSDKNISNKTQLQNVIKMSSCIFGTLHWKHICISSQCVSEVGWFSSDIGCPLYNICSLISP